MAASLLLHSVFQGHQQTLSDFKVRRKRFYFIRGKWTRNVLMAIFWKMKNATATTRYLKLRLGFHID
jgi:hypothetical protein